MVDSDTAAGGTDPQSSDAPARRTRRRAASRPAGPPEAVPDAPAETGSPGTAEVTGEAEPAAEDTPQRGRRRTAKKAAAKAPRKSSAKGPASADAAAEADEALEADQVTAETGIPATVALAPLFVAPDAAATAGVEPAKPSDDGEAAEPADDDDAEAPSRRRRRRGGRGRGKGESATDQSEEAPAVDSESDDGEGSDDSEGDEGRDGSSSRRRRRRRRRGGDSDENGSPDDPPNTVVKVREPRSDVGSMKGSTRLEAKRQRRREGREAGRRRGSILTESEFLARREAVTRAMLVRQVGDRTQIAVLEDGVLVEHYVNRASSGSMIGNVYLGRVQNVLPSMEAAFVDIGRGRNAVLYAGEVNWDAAGLEGQPRRIELALKSGDPVLVQVTKDPVGQKGARLTSQISLPGRYLVYVPDGSLTGISRKLPDKERTRLKSILKKVTPEEAGVIVRTAAEGASEEALAHDVERLAQQWQEIEAKAAKASPPALLYGEPDLAIKVVRDIFNEDVTSLVVDGADAWQAVSAYVTSIAPDLADRVTTWTGPGDMFATHRVDEQLAKALDRKVYLPSGGSLVIDRTEAMTVVDVNTGKFTGQGGNLEETVTRNNLEAAEEIVRQLRLRDIGGIIVIDFIDMVLESNRELVLRRLQECLGRDRTKHQVAEVTSLGLVQMTRKRIGQGLLEVFSTSCDHCNGRGVIVSMDQFDLSAPSASTEGRRRRKVTGVDPAEVAARALAAAAAPLDEGSAAADGGTDSEPEEPSAPEAATREDDAADDAVSDAVIPVEDLHDQTPV